MRFISILAASALLLLLASCSDSNEPAIIPDSAAEMQLRLTLDTPAEAASRAIDDDTRIDNVLLLLFTPDADGEPADLFAVLLGENISDPDEQGSRTFDARLGVNSATPPALVAVAVANAAEYFDTLRLKAGAALSYTQTAALLTEGLSSRSGADAAKTFTFWGRASRLVDTSLKAQTVRMSLLRDLAQIRVTLSDDTFSRMHRLASLHFYNRFDRICLFPLNYHLGLATLPPAASPVQNSVPQPLLTDSPTLSILTSEQDILMGGNGNPEDANRFNRPALIIGAYYRGTELSYYRLDLKDVDGKLYDILRNHRYDITVTSIDGPGQPTPEEAYFNITTSISADIVPWTDVNFDAGFDGGSWIAVPRNVTLGPAAGSSADLTLATNVDPAQWEIAWAAPGQNYDDLTFVTASTLDGDIFSVSLPDAIADGSGSATITFRALSALPDTEASRDRILYINVTPRLRLAISVAQTSADDSSTDAPWNTDYIYGDL